MKPGDHRRTPEAIWRPALSALRIDRFDLDPASNPHSTIPAARSLYAGGLDEEWTGNVWLNPPFSDISPWARKAASRSYRTLTVLTPTDFTTDWSRLLGGCQGLAMATKRYHFPVPGQPKGQPPMGVCLRLFLPGHASVAVGVTWLDAFRDAGWATFRRA